MANAELERRKYPRVDNRFVVSYRALEGADSLDISQTKNVSLGGMLFTTAQPFEKGTNLDLKLRLPSIPEPIPLYGRVIESSEVSKGLIYNTRLAFSDLQETMKQKMAEVLNNYLNFRKK